MGPRTPTHQTLDAPHFQSGSGSDPGPCHGPASQGGKVVGLGRCLVRTIHHFWPEFNPWLGEVPDTRFQPMVTCHRRFLLCWGLLLFLRKPASLGVLPLFPTPRGSLFDHTLPNPPPGLLLNCSRSSGPGFLPPNICFTDLHKGDRKSV